MKTKPSIHWKTKERIRAAVWNLAERAYNGEWKDVEDGAAYTIQTLVELFEKERAREFSNRGGGATSGEKKWRVTVTRSQMESIAFLSMSLGALCGVVLSFAATELLDLGLWAAAVVSAIIAGIAVWQYGRAWPSEKDATDEH